VTTMLATDALPLWTKKSVPGATPVPERKCPEQQHGVWVGGKCEVYHRLATLCFVVDLADPRAGAWAFAPRRAADPQSFGCERGGTNGPEYGVTWSAAAYALVQPTAKTTGVGVRTKVRVWGDRRSGKALVGYVLRREGVIIIAHWSSVCESSHLCRSPLVR